MSSMPSVPGRRRSRRSSWRRSTARLSGRAATLGVEHAGEPRRRAGPPAHGIVLVFTSEPASEGMPGVLIEAGLSGLPVVSTKRPGVTDVVVDGETGFVVPSVGPANSRTESRSYCPEIERCATRPGRCCPDTLHRAFTLSAATSQWHDGCSRPSLPPDGPPPAVARRYPVSPSTRDESEHDPMRIPGKRRDTSSRGRRSCADLSGTGRPMRRSPSSPSSAACSRRLPRHHHRRSPWRWWRARPRSAPCSGARSAFRDRHCPRGRCGCAVAPRPQPGRGADLGAASRRT